MQNKIMKSFYRLLMSKDPLYLFIDRPDKADDNAEALYDYYAAHYPSHAIYFVLEKHLPDWQRLEAKGVQLIPYGTLLHLILLLKASYYLSSHLPKYHFRLFSKKILKRYCRFKFIFLQHGVTHNDISTILNRHQIDLLITATHAEYENFIQDRRYDHRDKENTILSGFPRFDRREKQTESKTLLIFPTWRAYFTEHAKQETIPFGSSLYCQEWQAFLNHPMLEQLSTTYGYKLQFLAHPEVERFVDLLELPAYIEKFSFDTISIQSLLDQAGLLITDYSSLAFDMAIRHKALCYFQFDQEAFFSESHLYARSYFEYKKDGFGAVCEDIDSLLLAIEEILQNDGTISSTYLQRIESTFPYFDKDNSQRVAKYIEAKVFK